MNFLAIYRADIAQGVGFRVSLFVAGCNRHCKGCFNPESWDPAAGRPFDQTAKEKIFRELQQPWCRGLSILGGQPLSRLSDNRRQIIAFAKEVKAGFPSKDLWLYSGYTLQEIQADPSMNEVLRYIDVLVDGPFVEQLKDPALQFRGSKNQEILYRGRDF